jgi:hypothetical protein
MRQYFSNIPLVDYRGVKLRDLMTNARIAREVLEQDIVFYPYTLQDGDIPTSVAFDYYGSVEFDWLVLLSNGMVDPVFDWYMSQDDFDSYIDANYGSSSVAQTFIHHYESSQGGLEYTTTSYQYNATGLDENGLPLYPVDYYTWEMRKNEAKRSIVLINKKHASAIALELEKKLIS